MKLAWADIKKNLIGFVHDWEKEPGNERQQAQDFCRQLFNCYGIDNRRYFSFRFEEEVKLDDGSIGYIDCFWPGKILIEMKSAGKDLAVAEKQAKKYFEGLEEKDLPKLMVVSDFKRFKVVDMDTGKPYEFFLQDLPKQAEILGPLVEKDVYATVTQDPVNVRAAEQMGAVHDFLKKDNYTGHKLELYLARLVFCFFAEDAMLFDADQFYSYVRNSTVENLGSRFAELFSTLNTPMDKRSKYTPEELAAFPYVNGGLFAERIDVPHFSAGIFKTLEACAALDWSKISPAIFGSMFQGSMDAKERRNLGAHFTSEENILKVIKPLFLDELYEKYAVARGNKARLKKLQEEIARLQFLDPACGSGNFLLVAFRELRKLEILILKDLLKGETVLDVANILKTNIHQFNGIELEDFPCEIARLSLWLENHLTNMAAAKEFGTTYVELPLEEAANIVCGNALTLDWNTVVPKEKLSYIMGNPPFIGHKNMSDEQKKEIRELFNDKQGRLDYVACWYKKAVDYMQGTRIKTAFVSTNSIIQGVQVPLLWDEMINKGIKIIFAYRTFQWSNEARKKAAVHCVIIGFANKDLLGKMNLYIFDGEDIILAKNINPYLIDGPDIIVHPQNKAISNLPKMIYGNIPRDYGFYTFDEKEKDDFIKKEPGSKNLFMEFLGAEEFINNKKRWFLMLEHIDGHDIKSLPFVLDRVKKVRDARLNSKAKEIQKFAETPLLMAQHTQPENMKMILIPIVSSENRKYIPVGYIGEDILVNNQVHLVPTNDISTFGILISNVHMAWMRAVGGRLKSDYRYSKEIVYNTFPWPSITEEQRIKIGKTAQDILDARAKHSDSSLADIYDTDLMPIDLLKAHQANDHAVWEAYGKAWPEGDEAACVAYLMQMYQKLIKEGN